MNKQLKKKREKKRVWATQEEAEEFMTSDLVIELNSKIKTAYLLVTKLWTEWEEIESRLDDEGLNSVPSLRNDVQAINNGADRFVRKFDRLFFGRGRDTSDEGKRNLREWDAIVARNYEEFEEYYDEILAEVVAQGKEQRDLLRLRKRMGGGCEVCVKRGTVGCRYPSRAEMEYVCEELVKTSVETEGTEGD